MRCRGCKLEHDEGHGCVPHYFLYAGEFYEAIKVGTDRDTFVNDKSLKRCSYCNAPNGTYHHVGCASERCPVCGMAVIDYRGIGCINCGAKIKLSKEPQDEML